MEPSIIVASLRGAVDVARKFADTPLKAEYLDLMARLQDAKEQAFEMQEELHDARRQIRALEEAARVRAIVSLDRGVYWTGDAREAGPDGPYCTRCFDVDGKLVRVTVASRGYVRCPHGPCHATFLVWPEKNTVAPAARRSRGMIDGGF